MCERYDLTLTLGVFFYIKVLKCKLLEAWKEYALDIYFSLIL